MKPPSPAPCYAAYYTTFAEVARSLGYALAVHGSLQTDLDVIAIPWTEEAQPAEVLVAGIRNVCDGLLVSDVIGRGIKPHGRRAYTIVIEAVGYIDLSVMPLDLRDTSQVCSD